MITALLLAAAATAASAPAPTQEMFIDKDGCRWVRPIVKAKPKVARKPQPAASAASAPPVRSYSPAKPRKPLSKLLKPDEPEWQPINCSPDEPEPMFPAPFTPVPDEPVPPTWERVAAPPDEALPPPVALLSPPECDCFAGGPPIYFPPTFTTYGPPVYNPPSYGVTPVPEPSIIYLLVSGIAAIVFIRRRRRT